MENMKPSLNDERKPDSEYLSLGIARIKKPIKIERKFNQSGIMQHYEDKFVPYVWNRWLFTLALLTIYIIRVCIVGRFGLATGVLGFHIISMFVSTKRSIDDMLKYKDQLKYKEGEVDLEAMDGSIIESSDEAKPFIPVCSEHGYWGYVNASICICFVLSFCKFIDMPVSWIWTVIVWIFMFLLMGWDIIVKRVLKHKDVPVSLVKEGCAREKAKSCGC